MKTKLLFIGIGLCLANVLWALVQGGTSGRWAMCVERCVFQVVALLLVAV